MVIIKEEQKFDFSSYMNIEFFDFFFVYTFLLLIGIFRKETQVRIVNFNNFCFLSSCFVFLVRTTSKLLCIYFHFSYNPSVPSKLGTNAA